jgi:hypothetical protein
MLVMFYFMTSVVSNWLSDENNNFFHPYLETAIRGA